VDADHDQPLILVFLGPRAYISERAEPVDAGIGPEIDENGFSLQPRRAERGRVEPDGRPIKTRELTRDR
jgi:hypothetical protein